MYVYEPFVVVFIFRRNKVERINIYGCLYDFDIDAKRNEETGSVIY